MLHPPVPPLHLPPAGQDWYLNKLKLKITDVDDNVPEWEMQPYPYLAVVSPEAPAGTLVYQLRAQDGDEGRSGEVEYFLSDGECLAAQAQHAPSEVELKLALFYLFIYFFWNWLPGLQRRRNKRGSSDSSALKSETQPSAVAHLFRRLHSL